MNPFAFSIFTSVAVNCAFFAYAAVRKTDVVTDLSYSLSFAIIATAYLTAGGNAGISARIPAALTLAWAIRLGLFLYGRIRKMKVDHRFDGMRENPPKFARFWALQAATVAVVLLPVSGAIAASGSLQGFGPLQALGSTLWAAGFAIESVADAQKSAFKKTGNMGFLDTGLWRYSRHPNYFGESLLWWGLFVYVAPALSGPLWLVAAGPASLPVLLLFVSGVPILEKAADTKYGEDPAYREYKRSTSIFVPWFPRHAIRSS